MVLFVHTGEGPAVRKPRTTTEANQDGDDWAAKIAKLKEARRAGQKMREGKPPILSKTRRIKL